MIKENITRVDLIRNIGQEFPKGKGVEIGTFKGNFSNQIMNNWSGTLYMVDVWRPLESGYDDSRNHGKYDGGVYTDAMENIKGFEDRAIMVRATSEIASEMFNDESLDFVYIDANHSYDYVVQDIKIWAPKVKKGGFICGHDYLGLDWYDDPNYSDTNKDKFIWGTDGSYMGVFGVNPAVDEFCKEYGYELRVTSEWLGTWYVKK
jgi:hypothetical protein